MALKWREVFDDEWQNRKHNKRMARKMVIRKTINQREAMMRRGFRVCCAVQLGRLGRNTRNTYVSTIRLDPGVNIA